MAHRRSTTTDAGSAAVQQIKGRCGISDNTEQQSVRDKDDSLDASDVDRQESVKCGLQENGEENRTPVVRGISASPVSSKRKHKPNTMYAYDFVFSSATKSKVRVLELEQQDVTGTSPSPVLSKRRHKPNSKYADDFVFSSATKLEFERGSEQVSSKNKMKKVLLERESASSISRQADHAGSTAQNEKKIKLTFTNDLTNSEGSGRGVKKRGRKPKFHDTSLTEVENIKSGNLPSSLNLSPRGAHHKCGGKAGTDRGRKSHLANTSLPDKHLRIGFSSLPDTTEVPLTAPRKRGRPPKKPADENSKTDEQHAKHNHQNRNIAFGSRDQRSTTDYKCYSIETELPLSGRRKSKKSVYENVRKSLEVDADLASTSLRDELTRTDVDSSIVNEAPLTGPRKRGRPRKTDRNLTKTCVDNADGDALVNIIITVVIYVFNIFCSF